MRESEAPEGYDPDDPYAKIFPDIATKAKLVLSNVEMAGEELRRQEGEEP